MTPCSLTDSLTQACGLDAGGESCWTLVCHVLFLTLLRGVPNTHAIDVLMSHVFKRESRDACVALMAKQAERLFTPAEYLDAVCFVFEHAVVDSTGLWAHCAVIAGRQEEKSLQLTLKTLTVIQGRPRLRDRLKSTLNDPARRVQVFLSLAPACRFFFLSPQRAGFSFSRPLG